MTNINVQTIITTNVNTINDTVWSVGNTIVHTNDIDGRQEQEEKYT